MPEEAFREAQRSTVRPIRYAGIVSVSYVVFAAAYILLSDYATRQLLPGLEPFVLAQLVKGLLFVLTTGALLFLFTRHLYARDFRTSARLLRLQQALLDSERRATAGVLALAVAHDCSNQMQILSGNAHLLAAQRERLDETGRQQLERLQHAVDNLGAIVEQVRLGGRRAALARATRIELGTFVSEGLHLLQHHQHLRRCAVSVTAPGPVEIIAYPALLHDALVNLVLNAGDAVNGTGEIEVVCRWDHGAAVMEVHDNGPGVPPEARPRLFEAFHTTKPNGTGLGLVSVKTCAELHEGRAEYEPSPKGGACFRMVLHSVTANGTGRTAGANPMEPKAQGASRRARDL